jgi:hypothetical protein
MIGNVWQLRTRFNPSLAYEGIIMTPTKLAADPLRPAGLKSMGYRPRGADTPSYLITITKGKQDLYFIQRSITFM